jgi:hypothetical protein
MSDFPIADKFEDGSLKKPKCKLVGQDGNVFNLIGIVNRTLKGIPDASKEMQNRVYKAKSYSEALQIMSEYVDIY